MILDIKNIKIYLISPAEGKYRDRALTVFGRLIDEGFKNIVFVRSLAGPNNTASLTNTVMKIFREELKNDKPFLIVEDDIAFFNKCDTIELPSDCDLLYMGVSLWSYCYSIETLYSNARPHIFPNSSSVVTPYNDKLVRIKAMTSGHAILFNSREFIRTFMRHVDEISKNIDDLPHDLLFSVLTSSFNAYGLKAPLFYQDASLGGQEGVTKLMFNGECYR
jgi:hypothetical protein